jgi:hypothetical protein
MFICLFDYEFFIYSLSVSIAESFPKITQKKCARHIYAILFFKKKGYHELESIIGICDSFKSYTNLNYCSHIKDTGDINSGAVN